MSISLMLKCYQVTDVGRVRNNTALHCQARLIYSKLGKTAQVRFNRAKQLNHRRQRRTLNRTKVPTIVFTQYMRTHVYTRTAKVETFSWLASKQK